MSPSGPSTAKSISGISTQSTSRDPSVACRAMNPLFRPISCTIPMPFLRRVG